MNEKKVTIPKGVDLNAAAEFSNPKANEENLKSDVSIISAEIPKSKSQKYVFECSVPNIDYCSEHLKLDNENNKMFDDEQPNTVSKKLIPSRVFELLPPIIKKPFDEVIDDARQKDLSLFTLLVVLSGILPNYFTIYDGVTISSNLFLAIIGPFGEGKGFIKFFKKILMKINQRKLEEAEQDLKRYKRELAAVKAGTSDVESDEIEKPRLFRILIPANNSKSGMLLLLKENNGRGFIFETEADTLTSALKQDYSTYSEILRCGFQNESYDYFRKTNKESIFISSIQLSLLISGTCGQIINLIPSIENGLFSRFMFFNLRSDPRFHNVFDSKKERLESYFEDYAGYFDRIHMLLEERETPVIFRFQPHQQEAFHSKFCELKPELQENVDITFGGIVHRLGVIFARIAQILSIHRQIHQYFVPNEIVCEDDDFYISSCLVDVLVWQAIEMYNAMPMIKQDKDQENGTDDDKNSKKAKAYKLREAGMSYRRIALEVLGSKKKVATIYEWLNE